MEAVHLLDAPTIHEAVVDHRLGPGAAFLSGLKDQHNSAVEVACFGKIAGRAEQHRGVSVVPAGVHAAWNRRSVGQAGVLLDGQGVHVGPQTDNLA